MRAVFGPVGAVRDFRLRAEDRPRFRGERDELIDRRIDAGACAHARQRHKLGAEQECLDTAGGDRKLRVVKDHAAIAPVA